MDVEPKELDLLDSVRFLFTVIVPQLLRGTLAPSRFWLPILASLNAGQWSAATIDAFRRKYQSDRLWVRFVLRRTLLVLDGKGMGAVLNSAHNQADPPLKKIPLARFMPDSILVSKGADWHMRREFNEAVLDTPHCRHRHANAFTDIIFREVDMLSRDRADRPFDWQDFRGLAGRISQQVLLGAGRLEPELATEVDHFVNRANWFFLPVWMLHPGHIASFYGKIARGLGGACGSPSLMRESADRAQSPEEDRIRVDNQVAFWVFVIRDALELHVTRTLALIAAHPAAQDAIRAKLEGVHDRGDLTSTIYRFEYLESCVREQLRLWTPVPVLLRRATAPFTLPEPPIAVQDDQQLLLYPAYYHRDPHVFGHLANRFSPEHVSGRLPPTYYFSDGRQKCAGENLALLLVKFTLGALLAKYRFDLIGPQLDAERIPSLYDHFHVRFRASREIPSASRSTPGGMATLGADPACHA